MCLFSGSHFGYAFLLVKRLEISWEIADKFVGLVVQAGPVHGSFVGSVVSWLGRQ